MMQRQSAPEHILCFSNSGCLSVFDTSFKGSWRRTGSGNKFRPRRCPTKRKHTKNLRSWL